jgi:hypothetical protein
VGPTYGVTRVSTVEDTGLPSGRDTGLGLGYGVALDANVARGLHGSVGWEQHDFHFVGQGTLERQEHHARAGLHILSAIGHSKRTTRIAMKHVYPVRHPVMPEDAGSGATPRRAMARANLRRMSRTNRVAALDAATGRTGAQGVRERHRWHDRHRSRARDGQGLQREGGAGSRPIPSRAVEA